jgi:hypothetical protein
LGRAAGEEQLKAEQMKRLFMMPKSVAWMEFCYTPPGNRLPVASADNLGQRSLLSSCERNVRNSDQVDL